MMGRLSTMVLYSWPDLSGKALSKNQSLLVAGSVMLPDPPLPTVTSFTPWLPNCVLIDWIASSIVSAALVPLVALVNVIMWSTFRMVNTRFSTVGELPGVDGTKGSMAVMLRPDGSISQALGLMNNAAVLRQANRFAERVQKEAGADDAAQVNLAYRLALGREPGAKELDGAKELLADHGLQSVCWALLNSSEFLYMR